MRAFLWGVFLLLILAGIQLWPKQESLWLVVVSPTDHHTSAFELLHGTSSRIVDIVDDNMVIIRPSANMKPEDLYRKGALLVVNAAARYGCSIPTKNKWAKTEQ